MQEQLLFNFFQQHTIDYQLYEHQPIFTCDDKPVVTAINGIPTVGVSVPKPHFKTLFLQDKKGDFFLVSVIAAKRVDLRALSLTLGCQRLSFGKAEELYEHLKLTPGSVTPFGLMFDTHAKILCALDEDALSHPWVSFHPLRNDMTVTMAPHVFLTCMEKMGHHTQPIRIPIQPAMVG